MTDRPLLLIRGTTALEAVPGFTPADEGAPVPAPTQSPLAYLEALASGGHFADAAGFLASALPRREAVWWACRCSREALGDAPSKEIDAALRAAETWVASPGDVNRRKAMPQAEVVGFGHPAGCAGLAAFLSGGSLTPPDLKEVPPPEHAFARAVAGSVVLASVHGNSRAIVATRRKFVDIGLAVARGEDRWKDPT